MKDVAKLANVSTSTVSHVINQDRYVSQAIKQRVNDAIKQLNYAPSALAKSLKIKQTQTIGMLITESHNPFYAEIVRGVENNCYERGYSLILCSTQADPTKFHSNLRTLLQKRVDGLIIMCSETAPPSAEILTQYPKTPIVMMDWSPFEGSNDIIKDNSLIGGELATQHLIACGYRKIACIAGPADKLTALNRLAGFKKAMYDAHLNIRPDHILFCEFEFAGGWQAMQTLLQTEMPDAIVAGNDAIAVGVYQAAFQAGLKIPEDIAVIGYDDIELAKYLTPPLTTIHQPKDILGELAVDTLLNRILHPERKPHTLSLTPELIIRQSVNPHFSLLTLPLK